MITEVTADTSNRRVVTTRCGEKRKVGATEPLADANLTGWASMVTCGAC
jgi:hypothetical protein